MSDTWPQISTRGWDLRTGAEADTPFQLDWRTVLALVVTFVCGTLANAAGVGGGPIYMPMFNVLLGFELKLATALSQTVVACSAFGSTFYGLSHPSPVSPARPLVDLDLALAFIPALLIGMSTGVLLNVLLSEWLKSVLLATLLMVVARSLLRRGIASYRVDAGRQHKAQEEQPLYTESPPVAVPLLQQPVANVPHTDNNHLAVLGRLRACASRVQFGTAFAILALWVSFMALEMGKTQQYRCSLGYFSFSAAQILLCVVVTAVQIWRLSWNPNTSADPETRSRSHSESEPHQSGVNEALLHVVGIMIFAGVVAGSLGIGGAVIFNPFLLQLGMHPQVCASTAVLMILFSSSGVAVSFAFQNMLNLQYAAVFASVCFVASIIGVTVVGRFIKRTGRPSIIIVLMGCLVIVGCTVAAVSGSMRVYHLIEAHDGIGLQPFCPAT